MMRYRTYLCEYQKDCGAGLPPNREGRDAGRRSVRQLAADAAFGERLQFGKGGGARDVLHAAVGGREQPFRRQVGEGTADAGRDDLHGLRLGIAHADEAEDHGLVAEPVEGREVEVGLGGLD